LRELLEFEEGEVIRCRGCDKVFFDA
jgi:hypothetical protein